ncbi:hypothetical protein DESC_890001 [Desulfosarcina cetonica]|nr:hypothetical protein DESC_890001 [Desulfosarcina cetonica]
MKATFQFYRFYKMARLWLSPELHGYLFILIVMLVIKYLTQKYTKEYTIGVIIRPKGKGQNKR